MIIDVTKHKYSVRTINSVADLFADGPISLVNADVVLKNFDKLRNGSSEMFSTYGEDPVDDGVAGLLEDGRILVLNVRLSHFMGTFASHDHITVTSYLLTPR